MPTQHPDEYRRDDLPSRRAGDLRRAGTAPAEQDGDQLLAPAQPSCDDQAQTQLQGAGTGTEDGEPVRRGHGSGFGGGDGLRRPDDRQRPVPGQVGLIGQFAESAEVAVDTGRGDRPSVQRPEPTERTAEQLQFGELGDPVRSPTQQQRPIRPDQPDADQSQVDEFGGAGDDDAQFALRPRSSVEGGVDAGQPD